jgi:hypothetical protein
MPRRGRNSDDGKEYTEAEAEALADALDAALARHDEMWGKSDAMGTHLVVDAQVEWAGNIDSNRNNGVRHTRLEGLTNEQMRELRNAIERDRNAGRSFTDVGWHAQLRKLSGSERGRSAADRAGLSPSRSTFTRWLSGQQSPNKENRAKIQSAYESMRENTRASRGSAGALTRVLRQRYGTTIRFRDIEHMHFD